VWGNAVACFIAETPAIDLDIARVLRLFTASWGDLRKVGGQAAAKRAAASRR